ncbi:MAG TPA: hypothetical protein VHZ55_29890 [Bryobacteraceae bacterium]|jgi:hypothetical protein|nr:hypothetical protein [Bryobacteraceae bacterium]
MRETPGKTPVRPVEASENSARRISSLARAQRFRYYIHDGITSCRLQLIGELTESDVFDLNGCWRTAKTTLGKRQLVLDLHALRSVDEAGKQWLAGIAQDGAVCSPERFLRDLVAGKHTAGIDPQPTRVQKSGLFQRILGFFRGCVGMEAAK